MFAVDVCVCVWDVAGMYSIWNMSSDSLQRTSSCWESLTYEDCRTERVEFHWILVLFTLLWTVTSWFLCAGGQSSDVEPIRRRETSGDGPTHGGARWVLIGWETSHVTKGLWWYRGCRCTNELCSRKGAGQENHSLSCDWETANKCKLLYLDKCPEGYSLTNTLTATQHWCVPVFFIHTPDSRVWKELHLRPRFHRCTSAFVCGFGAFNHRV